jgi:hypothetical protein
MVSTVVIFNTLLLLYIIIIKYNIIVKILNYYKIFFS